MPVPDHRRHRTAAMRGLALLVAAVVGPAGALACVPPSHAAAAPHTTPRVDTLTAPSTIVAGDDRVRGERIADGSESWSLVMTAPDGTTRPVARQRESVARITWEGQPALLRITTLETGAGMMIDSIVADPRTLAPIAHRGHAPGRTLALDFAGRRVLGTAARGGGLGAPVEHVTAERTFDSAAIDLVAPALGLHAGETVRVAAYTWERGGLHWYTITASAGPAGSTWLEITDEGRPLARLRLAAGSTRVAEYRMFLPNGAVMTREP